MFSHLKKLDWVLLNWMNQLLFFIYITISLIINMSNDAIRPTGWIFMTIFTLVFALSSINSLCLALKRVRETVAISIILCLIFLIPLTYYALGGTIEVTSGVSLIFVLMSITFSPLLVGIGILVCALCYSGFIHYNNFFEQYPVFREALSKIDASHSRRRVLTLISKNKIKYFTVKTPATLQQISAYDSVYGNKDYWYAIYELNRKLIKSPDTIIPTGTKLAIPAARGKPYKIQIYSVPRESNLKEISADKEVYGNAKYWRYLYDANKSKVIDTHLTVLGGTRLIVPKLPNNSHYKFLIISLIYIAAALVGLCWRILLQELYRLLAVALSAQTGQTIRELNLAKEKLKKQSTANKALRKEIAMHIVEIDQIIAYKEPEPEKKSSK